MAYASVQLSDLTTALAGRLHDPGQVFWTNTGTFPELRAYLQEAIRVWGALTSFYVAPATFPTTFLESFYDLQVETTILAPTITAQALVADLQMRLMEPVTPTTWTGTEQFTLADLTTAVQRRRDQFLLETGQILTHRHLNGVTGGIPRVDLPSSIISLRRASFNDAYSAQFSTLWRDDSWALTGFTPGISAPGPPLVYALDVTRKTTMILGPTPIDNGAVRLLSVETGPAIDVLTPGLIGVPDDWAWVVTYGALADLFGMAGISADPARAAYCEKRWAQGLHAATAASRVIRAQVNGVPVMTMPIADADGFSPGWENGVDAPSFVCLAGLNILAVPTAPGLPYGIGVDCLVPATVPVLPTDYVQVPDESLDTILDYAQHLAALKQGGGALESAQPLLDRFYRACGVSIGKTVAEVRDQDLETAATTKDDAATPRLVRAS
jgi:hypothetical protein